MTLRAILKDPSLMHGMKIDRKANVVTVGDAYKFECSTDDVAKKVWARLSTAKFALGMTTRGKAQSREFFDWGNGKGTSTGWTQHN